MYARNANELRQLISEHPDEYPAIFLFDGSFAAACFDNKTVRELKSSFHGDPDPDDCQEWNLSAAEWKENIEMALIARQVLQKKTQTGGG